MKKLLLILLCVGWWAEAEAQVFEPGDGPRRVRTDGFWSDWFVQADLDMTLQNPYGYNFANVFPNGKSFGLDVAVGKWFSHQVGYRGKFNWENKLPLLKNDHANWLAPFDQPGVNREKGGYIALYGDVLLNLHNLFGPYRADRTWNLSLYPRIGVNYNFGVSKGALLAGIGLMNTYRLSPRWSIVLDAAYIMTGSGFVGKTKEEEGTGTGSNSNGYFSIGLGAQIALGKMKKGHADFADEADFADGADGADDADFAEGGVMTNGIWDNWFVQAGLDMSLMNPYGCDFSKVIPKGMTFGLNGALGKWFTPEFGLRGRVQWDNGLIPNNGLEWVAPADDPKQNYKKGGLATVALDAMLNLTNVATGYDPERRWHTSAYIRAGIITQFAEGSGSPLAGIGLEETYRLNDRWSLFGSVGYQVSTSEGMGYGHTGMEVAAGSNGFFDIDFGVKVDISPVKGWRRAHGDTSTSSGTALRQAQGPPFDKLRDRPSTSSGTALRQAQGTCLMGGHNWARFAVNTIASVGVSYVAKSALKKMIKEERPDHSDNGSFPSGHAAMAFAAARSIDKEFRKESIWIPIAGYAAATAVGVQRVASDRHHWYDVVAGGALGFGAAELTWWLSDKVFKNDRLAVGVTGNGVCLIVKSEK